jgi:hypothetical protein
MPTKSGNFVVVNFRVTNNSEETLYIDDTYLTLKDGQGRTNEVDSEGFEYIPANRLLFYEDVNPGVTQRGQAIFTIAPNASDFILEATDGGFSGNAGQVDLGV